MDKNPVSINEFDEAVSSTPAYMPTTSVPPVERSNINGIYANKFTKGLKDGTSPFLPKDGVINLKPAYNLFNNELHKNLAQIQFQINAAEKGYKDLAYVNTWTLNRARKQGFDCGWKKNELPVTTFIYDSISKKDESVNWYNIEQIENPENLKSFIAKEQEKLKENYTKDIEGIENQLTSVTANEEKLQLSKDLHAKKKSLAILNIDRTVQKGESFIFPSIDNKPESYLGAILTSITLGSKLEVEPAHAKAMADKMIMEVKDEHLSKNGKAYPWHVNFQNFVQKANDECHIKLKILHDEKSMNKSQRIIENKIEKAEKERSVEHQQKTKKEKTQEYERGR